MTLFFEAWELAQSAGKHRPNALRPAAPEVRP